MSKSKTHVTPGRPGARLPARPSLSVPAPLLLAALWGVFGIGGAAGCGPSEEAPGGEVQIAHPQAGELVSDARFRVRGEATEADTITVNGEETEVVGGKWEVLLEFEQGPATVTAQTAGASQTVDFTVDSLGPTLELQAPDHAQYIRKNDTPEPQKVTVSGTATDGGTGLKAVTVNDGVVETDADGTFETEVTLRPGLNTLNIRAVDNAGNDANALRGAMHGPFSDPTALVDPAFNLHITAAAVDTAEEAVEGWATPERITELLAEKAKSDSFSVQSVGYDSFDLNAVLKDDVIAVSVRAKALVLRGDLTLSEGSEPTPLQVTVDDVTVQVDMGIGIDENDELDFTFKDTELKLEENAIHIAVIGEDGAEELDEKSVRRVITDLAKQAFSQLVTDQLIDRLWDPSVLTRKIEVLGRELVFEVAITGVSIRPRNEIFLQTALAIPSEKWEEVPEVPGALNLPLGEQDASGQQLEGDLVIDTNRPALDRLLHGAWRAGLLHQQLQGDDFAGIELPLELNAGALAVAVDGRISEIAGSDTPAAIRLRPLLPPTVNFAKKDASADDRIQMSIGEMMVDLMLLPEGEAPVEIATIAVFLELDVEVGVDGIQLTLAFDTTAAADLVEEPRMDLNDAEIEKVVGGLMEAVPELIEETLVIEGERDLKWVTLQNPQLLVRGEEEDQASVAVDLEANPEGLEE